MAIVQINGAFSNSSLTLDLSGVRNSGGSLDNIGEVLSKIDTDNENRTFFRSENISVYIPNTNNTNLTSLGVIGNKSVWRLRENTVLGNTLVTLKAYKSEDSFNYNILEGFQAFTLSNSTGTHIYTHPNGVRVKAASGLDGTTQPPALTVDDEYQIVGSGFDDEMTGTIFDDFFNGRGGDDNVDGLMGNDTMRGDDGNDTLQGSSGDDVLLGQRDKDLLVGGDGSDVLRGGGGIDSFSFGSSDIADSVNNGSQDTVGDFNSPLEKFQIRDGLSVFEFSDRFSAGVGDVIYQNNGTFSNLLTRVDNSSFQIFAQVQFDAVDPVKSLTNTNFISV